MDAQTKEAGALNKWTATALLASLVCVVVLAFNVFKFPFLWDDYDFIERALRPALKDLLPDPSIVFYRPLSRELYAWTVMHLLGGSPVAAHLLNVAVVAGILAMLLTVVGGLAGRAAGILASLVFAFSAGTPIGISWMSGSQDLLCAFFLMLALHLQVRHQPIASAAAMAAALLSKETAVIVFPAFVAISMLRADRSRQDVLRSLIAYGTVAFAWAAIHPWTRTILSGSAQSVGAEGEYLAFRWSSLFQSALQGTAVTLHSPWIPLAHEPGRDPGWPAHLIWPAIIATGIVVLLFTREKAQRDSAPIASGTRLSLVAGSIVFAGSLLLTSLVLKGWSPHYICIPALGLATIAGPLLARSPRAVAVAALLAFLWFGIRLRGEPFNPSLPSEPNFTTSAASLQKVENGFRSLHPTMPAANVYISVQARGSGGIYRHLFRFQPLRVWYRQPDIWVLDPNRRRSPQPSEFLFWIAPNLDVYEIGLNDLTPRGPSTQINLPEYQKTLRGYALGLAGAGEARRAVQILTGMPEQSRDFWAFDRRTAVAVLLAAGRDQEAGALADGVPQFPPPQAAEAVVALVAEPITGLDLDLAAMRAFGLDPNDPSSLQLLMRRLESAGYKLAAHRFAERVQAALPGDRESAEVLRRTTVERPKEITVPVPYDIPQ